MVFHLRSLAVCGNNVGVYNENRNEDEKCGISRFRSRSFGGVVNFVREGNLKCHPHRTQISNRTQVLREESLPLTLKNLNII